MATPAKLAAVLSVVCSAALWGGTPLGSFLVTNDDIAPDIPNTATFYTIDADGTLGATTSVVTGGGGIAGGFFAAARVIVVPSGSDACVFVSDALSGDIVGIDAATRKFAGLFRGGPTDSGTANGIGFAASATYLYANFTSTSTIATFEMQSGCQLAFVSDIHAGGLNGGVPDGMAAGGGILVVTYGDGSIESFNISGGEPVSNGDLQNSTGAADDYLPNGVIVTGDGHYAIFGDASTASVVEVSDISSGMLTPTLVYPLGPAWNSGSVRLSPDETVLYVSNDSAGQVTAGFFNSVTGQIQPGCTSASLAGFYTAFSYIGGAGLQLATGSGGIVYVPEYGLGGPSRIGMLQFTRSGSACMLTEAPASPVTDPRATSEVLSIAVYPGAP